MKHFQTPEQVESAVKNGQKVFWYNENYKVIFDGNEFLVVYKMGSLSEDCVGLHWPSYRPNDFFVKQSIIE